MIAYSPFWDTLEKSTENWYTLPYFRLSGRGCYEVYPL